MDSDSSILSVLLIVLILGGGYFAACETALVSINHIRTMHRAENGEKRAEIAYAPANISRLKKGAEFGFKPKKWALRIKETYSDALCSILIRNNLVNIASSSVAATIVVALLGEAGVVASTGIMTVLLLIFREIVPKQLAKRFCDAYISVIPPVLMALMWITRPLVWLCMKLIHTVSKIWGGARETPITYDNLADVIETVEEEGGFARTAVNCSTLRWSLMR